MELNTARQAAHARGLSMQIIPGTTFAHTGGDVADLVEAVLGESHPVESMPSQVNDWDAFDKWDKECDAIRNVIWEAYAAGARGEARD